ncbi:MAG: sigma-70 family RNA polymerase sigma factor [Tissierellia bacterium]|nr:sigma-70 family RNA polymerase sigma factor [Tissierellia bacterium]MDD4779592.1 sigma-70 family RNA polymerase sigma factor [Tissierellia bacterium]
METENHLIEKAALGDEDSFSILIDSYKNYVFAIILNFIKDYNEVENVAQEVFFQIYVSLPKYDQKNFKAWIGRITTNKSIDWLRMKKSKFKDEVLDQFADNISMDQKYNPEILIIEKDKKEKLTRTLNSIPDIYRVVLEKFYFLGKSYELIAKEENVPIKTIASRLYRAKILLREKWRCGDESL